MVQGDHDRPGALASCFHWALFCWNHEEAQKRSSQGTPDWVAILVGPETQLIQSPEDPEHLVLLCMLQTSCACSKNLYSDCCTIAAQLCEGRAVSDTVEGLKCNMHALKSCRAVLCR